MWGGLVTIVVGMVVSMVVMPAILGSRGAWWVPGDSWSPMMAARYVANGAFPYLYEADRTFVATPLGAIGLAPVAALGQALNLTDNQRFPVPHPTLWLAYGPYAFALCASLFVAARALARRLWPGRPGAPERSPHVLWPQIAMFTLVVVPAAVLFGHFEDVLALAFVLLGIRSVLDGRWSRGALLLGVAIAFKQWALLGVPGVVALCPPGRRMQGVRNALMLPASLVALPLAADWSHASAALFRPQTFTRLGHAALWVHRGATPIVATPFRAGAILAAVGIAFLIRGRGDPAVVLAGFALAFLSRLAFEAVLFLYYLCPPLALLFFHERVRGGTGLRTVVLGIAWLGFFFVEPNPVLWWLGSGVLAVGLSSEAAGDVWRAARSRGARTRAMDAVPTDLAPPEPIAP